MAYQSEIEKLERQYADNPAQYFAPLADAHRKAGNIDLALDVVRTGLEKRPTYVSAHIVLGRCLLAQKNDAEAAKVFEHVLQLDAENIIALRILGEVAERTQNITGALGWLKRLLEVDPMNDDAQEAIKRLEAAPPPAAPVPEAAPVADSDGQAEGGAVAGFEATSLAADAAPAPDDGGFAMERAHSAMESGEPESGPAPTLEMESLELEHTPGAAPPGPESTTEPMVALDLEPTSEPPASSSELVLLETGGGAAGPAAAPRSRTTASWSKQDLPQDLPLILPEEEGPAQAVAAAPSEPAAPTPPAEAPEPEPVITETMAEVYLRQGLVQEAREVYRKLVQSRPGDAALRARLAELEQRASPGRGVAAPARSRFAAAQTGGVPARSFLSEVLAARPGATSMDEAFSAEPPTATGAPTIPAADELSLAAVFGEEAAPAPAPGPAAAPAPPGGFSFDEFFGGKPGSEPSAKLASDASAGADADSGGSDDFMSWLKGLKS